MKTAYVTGGTGCVGRNLINELLNDNWRVIAAHRRTSKVSRLAGLAIELKEVDLLDYDSVLDSLPEGTDALFHVAANMSHWPLEKEQQWKDNVLGTRHLVQAALAKKVGRFILTSTGATDPYKKSSRAEAERIESQYVRTKRLSEMEVEEGMAQGLDAVFIHPAIVVGAYDTNCYSKIFTEMQSGTLRGVLPGTIEFCGAQVVARAHVSAYEKGRTGIRYCLGGPQASWLTVYQKIARLLGVEPPQKPTPISQLYVLSYPLLWMSYVTRKPPLITPDLVRLLKPGGKNPPEEERKSREELGYQSPPLDQMLEECYQWLVQEGLIRRRETAARL